MIKTRQARIEEILRLQDWITHITVINQSHLHANHDQSPNTGESHYLLQIKPIDTIQGTRVDLHRRILKLLGSELANGLHSVSIILIPTDQPRNANFYNLA